MLNVLFAGTPECAVPSLEEVARKHRDVAVLSNAPAPAGRSGTPVPTTVGLAAQRLKDEGIIAAETPILETILDVDHNQVAWFHVTDANNSTGVYEVLPGRRLELRLRARHGG